MPWRAGPTFLAHPEQGRAYLMRIPYFHNLCMRVWLHSKIKEATMLRASQLASPVLCAITNCLIPTLNLSSSCSLSIFQKPASFASFHRALNPTSTFTSNSNSFHIPIMSPSFASPKGTFVIIIICNHNFILCKVFFNYVLVLLLLLLLLFFFSAASFSSGTGNSSLGGGDREILVQHLLVKEDDLNLLLELQRRVSQGSRNNPFLKINSSSIDIRFSDFDSVLS